MIAAWISRGAKGMGAAFLQKISKNRGIVAARTCRKLPDLYPALNPPRAPAAANSPYPNRRVSSSRLAGSISAVTQPIISIVAFRLSASAITP